MAYLNLRVWKKESPLDPEHLPELSAHGAPPGEVIHEALVDALTTLIVPGNSASSASRPPPSSAGCPKARSTGPSANRARGRSWLAGLRGAVAP